MNFERFIKNDQAKKVPINTILAKSLIKSSKEAIESAFDTIIKPTKLKTIFRDLYEGLREYCEAIGYLKGYKFRSHEVITYFIRDILKEDSISLKFDRYRELRNGINYYGKDIMEETVREALKKVPLIIKSLEKHLNFPL